MTSELAWSIGLVVGAAIFGIAALILVLWIALVVFVGAALILAFASAQGFLGMVAYVAAWVFLFPIMLIASLVVGGLFGWADWKERREEARERVRPSLRQRMVGWWRMEDPTLTKPPSDPKERYKWANRLPPYD